MIGLWLGTSSPNAMRLQVPFRMRPNPVLASAEVLQAAGVQPRTSMLSQRKSPQ
jgi:hypothetical protein